MIEVLLMDLLHIVILAIIQGLGEFLPISSSAHLILIPYLFDFSIEMSSDSKLAFDVALHFGTLMAVLVVFYRDWLAMFKGVINKALKKKDSFENKIFWYLVIATIPGALVGLLFEDVVEDVFREAPLVIAIFLAIMGALLYLGDKLAAKKYQKETSYEKITIRQALIIGLSQALAIIPGFSRSGTTLLTGRLLGLSREGAAKFTFMLSVPIIAGATLLKLPDLTLTTDVILGILVAAIVGILAIKFLLNYVKTKDFAIFAYYRVILAIIIIIKVIGG